MSAKKNRRTNEERIAAKKARAEQGATPRPTKMTRAEEREVNTIFSAMLSSFVPTRLRSDR